MTKFPSPSRSSSIKLLLILATATAPGCGILPSPLPGEKISDVNQRLTEATLSPSPLADNAPVPIVPLEPGLKQRTSTIELRWTIPAVPVDGFVVSYGFENEPLNSRVTVPLTELEREEESEFGPVYRYLLRDLPQDREVRVSIASYRGKLVSEGSLPQLVPVDKNLLPLDE